MVLKFAAPKLMASKSLWIFLGIGTLAVGIGSYFLYRFPFWQRTVTPPPPFVAVSPPPQMPALSPPSVAPSTIEVRRENQGVLVQADETHEESGESEKDVSPGEVVTEPLHFAFTYFSSKKQKTKQFDNWAELSHFLDRFEYFDDKELQLIIEFPSTLLGDTQNFVRTKKQFCRWLTRMGDYIFTRRLVTIRNSFNVTTSMEYMRVDEDHVTQRGCALFTSAGGKWKLSLRGLNSLSEIKVVGQLIVAALVDGKAMAKVSGAIPAYAPSHFLNRRDDATRLTEYQLGVADKLLKGFTRSREMKEEGIESNYGAFLLLSHFENIRGISRSEAEEFLALRGEFLSYLIEEVLKDNLKHIDYDSEENFRALCIEHHGNLLSFASRAASKIDLSEIILRSLFVGEE